MDLDIFRFQIEAVQQISINFEQQQLGKFLDQFLDHFEKCTLPCLFVLKFWFENNSYEYQQFETIQPLLEALLTKLDC